MADNEETWSDLVIDNGGKIRSPGRKAVTSTEDVPNAQDVLAQVAVEQACTKAQLKDIAKLEAFCLVVMVPTPDWVQPVWNEIRSRGDWEDSIARTSLPRIRTDESGKMMARALASGGRVFGVCHSVDMLPAPLLTGADMTITIPPANADVIAKAIKMITGKLPIHMPPSIGAGLSFEDIAGCLRPGSTAAECVDRLKRAAEKKVPILVDDDVPLFEDLHGYGAAHVWGMELLQDLDAWRRGELPWNSVSATLLLSSDPGLGKTSMARSLAKSARVNLISTSVASWFSQGSGYLDSIIKQLDEAFATARSQKPSLLLIDEIDSLPSRLTVGPKNADYWGPVITRMLMLLDGVENGANEGVIIVACTNFGTRLDPALTREGRLSKKIHIGPPDADALAGILRQHLGQDLPETDLAGAAHLGVGGSGAMAVEWVKNARRTARQAKRPMVLQDLVDAIAPADDRSDELRERIAVHEAGHAVLAHVTRLAPVKTISLVARAGGVGGFVQLDGGGGAPTREDIERVVVQTLGGRAAEQVIMGQASIGSGADPRSDLANATREIGMLHLSAAMGADLSYRSDPEDISTALARYPRVAEAVEADLRRLYAEALRLVRIHADTIVAVAEELLERRQLDGPGFLEIVDCIKAPREWPAPNEEVRHG